MPWWQQQLYFEGYVWEGLIEESSGAPADPTLVDSTVNRSGGTTITDNTYKATFSGLPGEMAAFGINERKLG